MSPPGSLPETARPGPEEGWGTHGLRALSPGGGAHMSGAGPGRGEAPRLGDQVSTGAGVGPGSGVGG